MTFMGTASTKELKEAIRWSKLSFKERMEEIEEKYRLKREEREARSYAIVKKNYQELIKK